MKNKYVYFIALLVLTFVASFIAIRIEILNYQVGGFLPRPQPPSMEGNDIPWREGSLRMTEQSFRRSLLAQRDQDITDKAIESIQLTTQEQKELDKRIRMMILNSKLKRAVEGLGVLQHAIVPIGLFVGVLLMREKSLYVRLITLTCTFGLFAAGFFMLYRQYIPAVLD